MKRKPDIRQAGFFKPEIAPPPWRVLICGDRNWTDVALVEKVILELKDKIKYIVHGDNGELDPITGMVVRGADKMAGWVCRKWGIKCYAVPAEWERYGRAAGPLRNQKMLNEYYPQVVIAFHDDITKSTGTKDMYQRAFAANIEAIIINHGAARDLPKGFENA